MSFKRWLTSVLCSCILLSFILVVPVSAADDDNYYSAPAVSDGSVSPASLGGLILASATDWSTDDRATLQGIYKFIQYMTTAPSSYSDNSVIGLLHRILNKGGSSGSVPNADTNFKLYRNGTGTNGLLFDIYTEIGNVLPYAYGTNVLSWLSTISSNVMKADTTGLATESTLSAISNKVATESTLSAFWNTWQYYFDGNNWAVALKPDGSVVKTNWATVFGNGMRNLTYDTEFDTDRLTLKGMIRCLQETLASDDDRQLAENYKENREQAETDFLTGKSGKTSLGKDDFGSLSSVGGTFHDISSLNGQASLDSFSSGLTDADTAGQGWFSQSTKESLDSVTDSTSSESTVSTFSDDGLYSVDVDSDPYNMAGFENNYAWLWGDKS